MGQTGSEMTPSTNDHESATSESADFAAAKKVEPGTGARIVRITAVIVIALAVGFFFVHRSKNDAEARLVDATGKEMAELPTVNVVTVTPSPGTQSLKLP